MFCLPWPFIEWKYKLPVFSTTCFLPSVSWLCDSCADVRGEGLFVFGTVCSSGWRTASRLSCPKGTLRRGESQGSLASDSLLRAAAAKLRVGRFESSLALPHSLFLTQHCICGVALLNVRMHVMGTHWWPQPEPRPAVCSFQLPWTPRASNQDDLE